VKSFSCTWQHTGGVPSVVVQPGTQGPPVSLLACSILFWLPLFTAHRSTGHFPPLLGWVFPPWSESLHFFLLTALFFFPLPLTFSWFPALLHPTAMPLRGSQSESFPPFFHWLLAFFQVAFFPWPTSPPPHSTLSEWHVFFSVHIPCLNKPGHPSLSHPQWVTFPPFVLTIPIATLPGKWPWFFLCSDYPSQPEQTRLPPSLLPHHPVSGHFFSLWSDPSLQPKSTESQPSSLLPLPVACRPTHLPLVSAPTGSLFPCADQLQTLPHWHPFLHVLGSPTPAGECLPFFSFSFLVSWPVPNPPLPGYVFPCPDMSHHALSNERRAPTWSDSSTSIPRRCAIFNIAFSKISPHSTGLKPSKTTNGMSAARAPLPPSLPLWVSATFFFFMFWPILTSATTSHHCQHTQSEETWHKTDSDDLKLATFWFRAPYLRPRIKSPPPLSSQLDLWPLESLPPSSPVCLHCAHVSSDARPPHTPVRPASSVLEHPSPTPTPSSPLPHSSSPKLQRHWQEVSIVYPLLARTSSHPSLTARIIAIIAAPLQCRRTYNLAPAHRLPARRQHMHNTTRRPHFCAGSNMWVHSFPPPVLCCLSHPPDAILPNATPACLPACPHHDLCRNWISCTVKASKTAVDAGDMCPPLTPSCCHPAPAARRRNDTDRRGHTILLPCLRWMSYLALTSMFLLYSLFFFFCWPAATAPRPIPATPLFDRYRGATIELPQLDPTCVHMFYVEPDLLSVVCSLFLFFFFGHISLCFPYHIITCIYIKYYLMNG